MPDFSVSRTGFGYVVAVDGLNALREVDELPAQMKRAALQAVNRTASRTRTRAARLMRLQVNFPPNYLSGENGRLAITKQARGEDLEAVITGRWRPTSLARFVTAGSPANTRRGVTLQVDPGASKRSRRMFLMRLRVGTESNLDTKSNLGLAIRLRPGERVENKTKMVAFGKGLYLLYGPSVASVFATVATDVAPEASEFMEREFLRLMELDQ